MFNAVMVNAVVGAGFTNQFVEPLAYFVKPAPRAMPMQLEMIQAIKPPETRFV